MATQSIQGLVAKQRYSSKWLIWLMCREPSNSPAVAISYRGVPLYMHVYMYMYIYMHVYNNVYMHHSNYCCIPGELIAVI